MHERGRGWHLLALCALSSASVAAASLKTVAEQSAIGARAATRKSSGCVRPFSTAWPGKVRCFEFGRTPEGRPMLALVASTDGVLDAARARQAQRPVVLMQGGIHAGEIDGKDAGFLALRELLDGKAAKGALERVTFVFVPVFNVDGHERFGRWNRPNQVGPEEMGWRTTAQNLNLNRDYAKADAPEMQAMLRLLNAWDPILYVDLHVTDGAQFEHDVSFSVAPTLAGDEELRAPAVALRDELMQRMRARRLAAARFLSVVRARRRSGVRLRRRRRRRRASRRQYWAARNRLGVLVETHSWKDYPTRVRITHNSIIALLELAARDGAQVAARPRAARTQRAARSAARTSRSRTRTPTTCARSSFAATSTRASRRRSPARC